MSTFWRGCIIYRRIDDKPRTIRKPEKRNPKTQKRPTLRKGREGWGTRQLTCLSPPPNIPAEHVIAWSKYLMDEWAPNPTPCLEIAHVLFMDVVAYSTLHMDRQQQLLHNLQEAVRTTPTFARAQAEEQLIRLPTGDGMALVFFHDPEAPVRCAVELAKILHDSPDIKLRMGIHTGPVYRVADINANRNVAGGGINTAQRVMDCGDAGHILVSKAMVDVLGQLECWDCSLYDLGEAEAKHGVRVHIFNLFTGDLGNPKIPNKIRTARAAQKSGIVTNKRTKRLLSSSGSSLNPRRRPPPAQEIRKLRAARILCRINCKR